MRIAVVTWRDAAFHPGHGRGLVVRTSVGFLVGNGRAMVSLAQTHDKHGSEEVLSIPRVNVISIQRLVVKK